MELSKSFEYFNKALKYIPDARQTFSKGYNYFPYGAAPLYLEAGKGSHVLDVDGNEYLDYIMGLCTVILGYNYPRVTEAILKQAIKGSNFSLATPAEIELATILNDTIPCAEMVRFCKTGSEACQGAVRIARYYTKREHVATFGYHGWHSEFACITERSGGIPSVFNSYMHEFKYNDINSLAAIFEKYPKEIACVIIEPVIATMPQDHFLENVQKLCRQYGALLIFDEVVTMFRWSLGGAQEFYQVIPDIACLGKAMGNGAPLSAIVGKAEYMEVCKDIFFSGTYSGESHSIAAAIATTRELKDKVKCPQSYCWAYGAKLMNELAKIEGLEVKGFPARPFYSLTSETPETKTLLMLEVIKRGILAHYGYFNISYSHSLEDMEKTITVFNEAVEVVRKAETEGNVKEKLGSIGLISSSFRRM